MRCPRCGSDLKDNAKFCTACGGKIDKAAPAAFQPLQAPAAPPPSDTGIDYRFQRDKFLFNQPIVRVRDVYHIFDEQNGEILFARRLMLALKRHISIFADREGGREIMKILQDNILTFLYCRYTLVDMQGTVLARFRRRNLMSTLRRTWDVLSPDGHLLGTVMEDSWGKALFRRFVPFGDWFKTDFIFSFGGRTIGKYIRRWTLNDKYILDLTDDPERTLDRRAAVALGILLDTGEGR